MAVRVTVRNQFDFKFQQNKKKEQSHVIEKNKKYYYSFFLVMPLFPVAAQPCLSFSHFDFLSLKSQR